MSGWLTVSAGVGELYRESVERLLRLLPEKWAFTPFVYSAQQVLRRINSLCSTATVDAGEDNSDGEENEPFCSGVCDAVPATNSSQAWSTCIRSEPRHVSPPGQSDSHCDTDAGTGR